MQWVFVQASITLICSTDVDFELARPKVRNLGIEGLIAIKRKQVIEMLKECNTKLLMLHIPSHAALSQQTQFMATNYFRQWVITQLKDNQGLDLEPGYACIYRRIRDWHKAEKVPATVRSQIPTHFSKMRKKLSASDLDQIAT